MKVKDILDLIASDTAITICEENGRMHYVGAVQGAHRFDDWELEQIRASGSRVVLIIASKDMLKMVFVFNHEKAHALGYSAQTCYEAIDKLFARYGIVPTSQGVYEAPDNQNSFNAFGAAQRLPYSNWFLQVIDQWFAYDEDGEPEDCLAIYYKISTQTYFQYYEE